MVVSSIQREVISTVSMRDTSAASVPPSAARKRANAGFVTCVETSLLA